MQGIVIVVHTALAQGMEALPMTEDMMTEHMVDEKRMQVEVQHQRVKEHTLGKDPRETMPLSVL